MCVHLGEDDENYDQDCFSGDIKLVPYALHMMVMLVIIMMVKAKRKSKTYARCLASASASSPLKLGQ